MQPQGSLITGVLNSVFSFTHIICKNNLTLSSSPDIPASVVDLALVCNLSFIHEHCKRLMDNRSDRPCVIWTSRFCRVRASIHALFYTTCFMKP